MPPSHATPSADLRILAAAEQLFADQGFKETSIQMLADTAGVNRALIFYYYKSKETLYRQIIERACSTLGEELRSEMHPDLPPQEALVTWIRLTCRSMARNPHLLRILLREVSAPGTSLIPVGQHTEDVERPLREILERGCGTAFRPVDPGMTAISLMGILTAFFRRRYVTGQAFDADIVAGHVTSLVLDGLRPA